MQTIYEGPTGPLPPNYVEVHRWIDRKEISIWYGRSNVPSEIRTKPVHICLPGAPPAGGTLRPVRVEFFLPASAVMNGSNDLWKRVGEPCENIPILNVRIVQP